MFFDAIFLKIQKCKVIKKIKKLIKKTWTFLWQSDRLKSC